MDFINMYEGKDINITLDGDVLKNFVISKFLLEEKVNTHSVLALELEIDTLQKNKLESSASKEDPEIKIELSEVAGKRKIFEGLVKYFEILNYGSNGGRILIEAFSKSILMDKKEERKYRVFQDINLTYSDIIDEVNKDYKEKKFEVKYPDSVKSKINTLIIQYNETDWEFLTRMATHLKTAVFITEQGVITFGVIETGETKKENMYFSDYSIVKDYKNLYYKLNSGKVISTGDTVSINPNVKEKNEKKSGENSFTVYSSKIFLKNYILKTEFMATLPNNYHTYKKYNKKIKGSTVEGKVEKVFEENGIAKMEVSFFSGFNKIIEKKENNNGERGIAYKDYGIKKYPLSYQTFYSQTNTGFFCTPEINDTVEVYFPNEDESFAKVSWAVNNEGNGRFSNYEKRNFHINGKDFNFTLNKDTFEVNVRKSYTRNSQTSLESAESLVNKGSKNTVIISDDYMGIESIGEASLYGKSINIIGKESGVRLESPNEIRIKGKKVHNN